MSSAAEIALVLATLLCSLVAGFLFAFAVVVMPGIRRLRDREFLLAFQEIDGVIQRGEPLFGLVWLGSVLVLMLALALGAGALQGLERTLLALACGLYLLGVQLPTFLIHIPLNNGIKALDIDGADEAGRRAARQHFEPKWNRWNRIRTVLAVLTAALLLGTLVQT